MSASQNPGHVEPREDANDQGSVARVSPGHDRASYYRGIRAAVSWLHVEAGTMNDPWARNILHGAAWRLGVHKPALATGEPPDTLDRCAIAVLTAALTECADLIASFGDLSHDPPLAAALVHARAVLSTAPLGDETEVRKS